MGNFKVGNFRKVWTNGKVLNVTSMVDINLKTLLGSAWNLKNVKVILALKSKVILDS